MEGKTKQYFGVVDTLVFAGSLLASGLVGLYFAVKDRKRANAETYYFGGKDMSAVAVGISLSVTSISALTIIGLPTETYLYGTVALWFALTSIAGALFSVAYYVPLLHRLQLLTLYQYLEMRFHPSLRTIVSACEVLKMLIYMSFAVYGPALALNAVTPISLHWSILLTSGVCTAYTSLGGVKAVVWTDVLQFLLMFVGAFAALVKATIDVGGVGATWSALERTGRLNFFEVDPNPTIRNTMWTLLIGASISESANVCVNQSVCQRYLSCKNVAGAKKAAYITMMPKVLFGLIAGLSGCVAFAYFEGCDPLQAGVIAKSDQTFPYLVLLVFRNLPGMAGLFVAATYSGTMSTVSSGINSLSALFLQDFLLRCRPSLSVRQQNIFSKFAGVMLGLVVTMLAYLALFLEGTVLSLAVAFKGSLNGSLIGIYLLGMFFPWCNSVGAGAGQLTGAAVSLWVGFGGVIYGKSPESQRQLPLSTMCCNATDFGVCSAANFSATEANFATQATTSSSAMLKEYSPLYSLSYWYNAMVGLVVTVVIGLLVSFMTGPNKPEESDPKLFCQLIDNPGLPEKVRLFFRLGVPPLAGSDDGGGEQEVREAKSKKKRHREKEEQEPIIMEYRESIQMADSLNPMMLYL